MPYRVLVTTEGARHLRRLPEEIRTAVLAAIFERIAAEPYQAGKALRGELEGLRSARRGDYRVIYEIDEPRQAVIIHRAQHSRAAYRRR